MTLQQILYNIMGIRPEASTAVPRALEPHINPHGENAREFRNRFTELDKGDDLLSKITCPNNQCQYRGNKPVCYGAFYEDCKKNKNG